MHYIVFAIAGLALVLTTAFVVAPAIEKNRLLQEQEELRERVKELQEHILELEKEKPVTWT